MSKFVFNPDKHTKDEILWYVVQLREEGFVAMADLLLDYAIERKLI